MQTVGYTVTTAVTLLLLASTQAIGSDNENRLSEAEEVAKELANPNTALASMNFKFQHSSGDQADNFNLQFQPVLPFPLDNGDKIIFRPTVSFKSNDNDFRTDDGFSDIAFDLAYAPKMEGGLITAFGVISTLPTGSNGFSTDQWAVGPEFLFGKATKDRVLGVFPNHQWGVTGDGVDEGQRMNITSAQLFWVEILGGGWTIGTSPTMTYDWNTEQATIPINLNMSKTVVIGSRPWKFGFEANYYVEKADHSPEFMLGFNVTPVVENKVASIF